MPSYTLADAESRARDISGDNDATSGNRRFTQAEVWRFLNRYYIQHKLATDNRPRVLTPTTTGLTFTDATTFVLTSALNIRRIINAWHVTTAGATTVMSGFEVPYERCSEDELLEWMQDYAYAASPPLVFPQRYSAARVGTDTAASVGKWRVGLHPVPNFTTYVLTECEIEPAALVSGTDIFDVLDDEGYGLSALAAAFMVKRMGREWLVEDALAEVPQSMQALAASIRTQKEPHRQGQETRP